MDTGKISSPQGTFIVLAIVLATLTGGTWAIQKLAIERLLFLDAVSAGYSWASYLAQSIPDFEAIAEGAKPSSASMTFFERAQKVGHVFRYKIFDRHGYLRLVSDELTAIGTDTQNLSEHNAAAASVLAMGRPHVIPKEGTAPARPPYFSEAYVPVTIAGRTIAIVEAYVDQTEKRERYYATVLVAGLSLSLLTAFAFCVPAYLWYRRTKEKQRADERLSFLAKHDALTGLLNRNYLAENLNKALTAREGGVIAVHHINIDRFKDFNDAAGHDSGDELIRTVAARLLDIAGGEGIVARLGSDEFAVLQTDAPDHHSVEALAARIVAAMRAPLFVKEHSVDATVSVGVALAPRDGNTAERVLKSAALALHRSKLDGGNCLRVFESSMDVEHQARLNLEKAIRDALVHDRFELYYQPIIARRGERLVGFEALLRLKADDGSFILPARFIPVAEEIGLIGRIGAWVLREACRTAAVWPGHLKVAVNLSAAQFAGGGVRDDVAAVLAETGFPAHRLELEITESLLLDASGNVMAELASLKALGVAIVMDDFGTGYSSLSYLWRFHFDRIKIDRAFMTAFDAGDPSVEKVIHTIVALGRALNMRITVEGIENERQAAFLGGLECDELQGFHYGRPMPAADVAATVLADFRRGTERPGDDDTRRWARGAK